MCETREINDKAIISAEKNVIYTYLGDKNFSLNYDDLYKFQFLLETDDYHTFVH